MSLYGSGSGHRSSSDIPAGNMDEIDVLTSRFLRLSFDDGDESTLDGRNSSSPPSTPQSDSPTLLHVHSALEDELEAELPFRPLQSPPPSDSDESPSIKNVWRSNLREAFFEISRLRGTYNYVAMDTEFPGLVAQPLGEFYSSEDYHYQSLRINVNLLKLIQLGLTFMDEKGNLPPQTSTWQFNFSFDLDMDAFSQASITLLEQAGVRFSRHKTEGICPAEFAELFISSGFVLTTDVTWLSFHSCYDFGYLVTMLSGKSLPRTEPEFISYMKTYFPVIYDVKSIIQKSSSQLRGGLQSSLQGGLQSIAEQLKVERVGIQHQAGSDSFVTGMTFFRLKQVVFGGYIDHGRFCGKVYGIENKRIDNRAHIRIERVGSQTLIIVGRSTQHKRIRRPESPSRIILRRFEPSSRFTIGRSEYVSRIIARRSEPQPRIERSESQSRIGRSESPTQIGRSESPTQIRRSKSPTQIGRSESPTQIGRSDSPTQIRRSKSPTQIGRSESPTQIGRSESPTQIWRSESPTQIGRSKFPTPIGHSEPQSRIGHSKPLSRIGRSESSTENQAKRIKVKKGVSST